jgi:hypothetical protein
MKSADSKRDGSALLPSLVAVLVLAAFSGVVFRVGLSVSNEVGRAGREMRALYLAEAGLGEALLVVAEAVRAGDDAPGEHGTRAAPVLTQSGGFWARIQDNGDDTYTVVSTGEVNGATRSIEGVLRHVGGSVFDHAVFAGNTSGDPDYTLRFGGAGSQRDEVRGNVFSAGDVLVDGDARVDGDVAAGGTITGTSGTEGVSRPLPDIAGMDYATNHDVDVAAAFAAQGVARSNALGGTALELPESDPAHIFRKNPSDRLTETSATAKDDYFLEDPYMPVTDFTAFNGRQGHSISLAGVNGKPGSSGNGLVYYVDGNLWVHNKPFGRLRFLSESGHGTQVTFVVKGNVYFSDDVLLEDDRRDAVAFIAIKDAAQPDSGNVYLGDPRYGTIDRMQTYLYAEHDFLDNNLAADGSKIVELFGNMTAGNHVAIQRDFAKADGTVAHSKLSVFFDDRLSKGEVTLPGIPRVEAGIGGFELAFWREVADP